MSFSSFFHDAKVRLSERRAIKRFLSVRPSGSTLATAKVRRAGEALARFGVMWRDLSCFGVIRLDLSVFFLA